MYKKRRGAFRVAALVFLRNAAEETVKENK